ncbi:MAG: hypothetical protein K9J12_17460 [Melioribacteraceae bacterium]|nr:hypothetical protein [Melioribacteraceae bacterium]MCF8263480.1 hypothetical protein [Melioribacteraceae bacterium]MCF8431668.1 hypothetical protein [Melioribacteraceae bacterium]
MKRLTLLIILLLSTQLFANWTTLYKNEQIIISFLFYAEADNYNNGVVLKIENLTNNNLSYKFKLIFKAGNKLKSTIVEDDLLPNQIKAGENEGLFWIPFPNVNGITEVGITSIDIQP